MMFINHGVVKLLSPILIFLQLMGKLDCAPYNPTANKGTLLYRFGSLYSRENTANPVTPLFSTPFHSSSLSRNRFTERFEPKFISTTTSAPPLTSSYRGTTKQIVIDEQILYEIFGENGCNKTTASKADNDDFATDINIETTTFDTPTTDNEDYRFSGGIAAQHAALSLIGR